MKNTFHIDPKLIHVVVTGDFNLEEAQSNFLEILEKIKSSRVEKVLMDGRQITGEVKPMERFYYGDFCAKMVMKLITEEKLTPKFAYVLKYPILDPGRFGENVAVNRGMIVKMFEDPEAAKLWLEKGR